MIPRTTDVTSVASMSAEVGASVESGLPMLRVRNACRNVIGTSAIATIAIRLFHCARYNLIAASRISPTPIGRRASGRTPEVVGIPGGGGGKGGPGGNGGGGGG